MSILHAWKDENSSEPKMKSSLSSEWTFDAPIATPKLHSYGKSESESILNKYKDLLKTDSNESVTNETNTHLDRPFDFFDEDEFLFGANLLHKNIACVGDDITRLIQMAQEPWPDNVKLFQPYEVEQILLPDNANCLAVQAFLKMCNLPFEVEMRWNAEFMSPSGRVPFIKCGAFVVSELEPIVQFCGNKGASLSARLTTEERAEMRAYMSLISNVLLNAELYISWLEPETYNAVTKARNASVYPWPLGWLQTRSKRSAVAKRLKALNWHDKTTEQVLSDVEQCCNSLSQRLGEKDYFFGIPTPLDALIYGHIRALLGAIGPKAHLMIRPITSILLKHTVRVAKLTEMTFKPQEEYLITQALSPVCGTPVVVECLAHTQSSGFKRSKHSGKSRDRMDKGDSVFGFKPFSAQQVVVMSSKDDQPECSTSVTNTGNVQEIKSHTKERDSEIYQIVESVETTLINNAVDKIKFDEEADINECEDTDGIKFDEDSDINKCEDTENGDELENYVEIKDANFGRVFKEFQDMPYDEHVKNVKVVNIEIVDVKSCQENYYKIEEFDNENENAVKIEPKSSKDKDISEKVLNSLAIDREENVVFAQKKEFFEVITECGDTNEAELKEAKFQNQHIVSTIEEDIEDSFEFSDSLCEPTGLFVKHDNDAGFNHCKPTGLFVGQDNDAGLNHCEPTDLVVGELDNDVVFNSRADMMNVSGRWTPFEIVEEMNEN